jgi:hypothetical protein
MNSKRKITGNDWRSMRARIADKKKMYEQNLGKMDRFTQETIWGEIKEDIESQFSLIAGGAIGEYKQAIKKYQDTGLQYDKAYSAEINRWDPAKLQASIANTRALVELAISNPNGGELGIGDAGGKLQAIYSEAKASGDLYKQRGAFEVLRNLNVNGLPREEKLKAFHVSKAAEGDLAALRQTPDMDTARKAQGEALTNILVLKDELIQTSKELGQGDPIVFGGTPFSNALNMVQVNRQTGEVLIFPEDSPEVTGIDLSKMPQEV